MKKLKSLLLVLISFLLCLFLFFPWDSLQAFVTAKAFKIAAQNGIYASAQSAKTEGLLDKSFVYNGFVADFPLLQLKLGSLSVNPKLLLSLFGQPEISAELGKGSVTLVTKQQLDWNFGSLNIAIDKATVRFSDINLSGRFSAQGFFEVTRASGKISRAQLVFTVPEDCESAFEFLSRGAVSGLTKQTSGKWRLVR